MLANAAKAWKFYTVEVVTAVAHSSIVTQLASVRARLALRGRAPALSDLPQDIRAFRFVDQICFHHTAIFVELYAAFMNQHSILGALAGPA
jgi:hypothetical protein